MLYNHSCAWNLVNTHTPFPYKLSIFNRLQLWPGRCLWAQNLIRTYFWDALLEKIIRKGIKSFLRPKSCLHTYILSRPVFGVKIKNFPRVVKNCLFHVIALARHQILVYNTWGRRLKVFEKHAKNWKIENTKLRLRPLRRRSNTFLQL